MLLLERENIRNENNVEKEPTIIIYLSNIYFCFRFMNFAKGKTPLNFC